MHTEIVLPGSKELVCVKQLWRGNSEYLGFYPDQAFDERAEKKQILIAVQEGIVVGYVLFFATLSRRVRITHLCVSEDHRGAGVARRLVTALREHTRQYYAILLHCRRDFPAWKLWPKLGFQAISEKVGNNDQGIELTLFSMPNQNNSLLPFTNPKSDSIRAVLDANVFYDLNDCDGVDAQESRGLTADWIRPLINLMITPELSNEIHRNANADVRRRRMADMQYFEQVQPSRDAFDAIAKQVQALIGNPKSDQDASDQRQLAWTIASGADVFVTRDDRLLMRGRAIYDTFGLRVERPSSVVSYFEEIQNEQAFQRNRLRGTSFSHARQSGSVTAESLAMTFVSSSGHEKQKTLERTLNTVFSNPRRYQCNVVYDSNGAPTVLYVTDFDDEVTLNVPIFRVSRSIASPRLANTLIRSIASTVSSLAVKKRKQCVCFSDNFCGQAIQQVLSNDAFLESESGWSKLCLSGLFSPMELLETLQSLTSRKVACAAFPAQLLGTARLASTPFDVSIAADIESLIWPGKLIGASIPTFVIPIRPEWAEDLLDGRMAKSRLWAADPHLALNHECVYYRKPHPPVLTAPSRALWYVTDNGSPNSKQIRACSQVLNVEQGHPKVLYRKYRRLGVYEWEDVIESVRERTGTVMAVHIKNTELSNSPLKWESIRRICGSHGKANYTFFSPVRINDEMFADLYSSAFLPRIDR